MVQANFLAKIYRKLKNAPKNKKNSLLNKQGAERRNNNENLLNVNKKEEIENIF